MAQVVSLIREKQIFIFTVSMSHHSPYIVILNSTNKLNLSIISEIKMIVIITFLTFTYAQSIWNIFGSDDLVSEDLAEDGIEKEQVISLDEQ